MEYKYALWDILKEINNVDDPQFEFLIGCFNYCLNKEGLTDKQAKYVDKYIKKYSYIWPPSQSLEPNLIKGGQHGMD